MRKFKNYLLKSQLCLALVLVLILQPLNMNTVRAAENYYWPTPSVLTITSGRGYSSSHKGIDIAAPLGTNIYATKSGTIIAVGTACSCQANYPNCNHKLNFGGDWIAGIGSGIVIKHDDGSGYSIYGHMTANSWPSEVYQGAHVQQGQFIGTTGQSGYASGPHLHFELMDNSAANRWNCQHINNNKEKISYVYSYNGLGASTENTLLKATGVTSVTETSARINATMSPGSNVTEAGFYLGTSTDNMQKVVESASAYVTSIWYDLGTGKWTSALNEGTTYYYKIYAIVGSTTYTTALDSFTTGGDGTPPVISNIYVTDISHTGYTVVCTVTDNKGIDRVCFPTWTDANGQDDIDADWYNTETATSVSGNTYSFRVNASDHNNEYGNYTTHIYAYDTSGNYVSGGIGATVPRYVPFSDVEQGTWYYNYVAEVYEKGYMVGSGTKFNPGGLLTRGEIVTTLYSVNGKPNTSFIGSFSDVKSGQWYSNPISWAFRNGIASGYANGKFGVSDFITREQFALMLYQYAATYGYNTNYNSNILLGYTDAGKISSWANTAMKWAVTNGIISGKTTTTLDPKGNATRAECATMITKLIQLAN